jgi:hypothetical protein
MKLSATITIPTQVMARQVGEETVILDLVSGSYFGLDTMGTRIWQLIGEGRSLGEVCELLLAEYDAPREQVEKDVLRLLDELSAAGLVNAG